MNPTCEELSSLRAAYLVLVAHDGAATAMALLLFGSVLAVLTAPAVLRAYAEQVRRLMLLRQVEAPPDVWKNRQRRRVRLRRPHVQEVDVLAVDLSSELRVPVQLPLVDTPVVPIAPVRYQLFQVGSVRTVLPFFIGEIIGPAYSRETFAEIGEGGFRNSYLERRFLHK